MYRHLIAASLIIAQLFTSLPGSTRKYQDAMINSTNPIIWQVKLHTPDELYGLSWTQDSQGNVYFVGLVDDASTSSTQCVFMKYDANGQHQWTRHYDLPNGGGGPFGLAVDQAGQVYIATNVLMGYMDFDYVILSYDASGSLRWEKHYADSAEANGFILEGDALFLIGLTSQGCTTLKYDLEGNFLWERHIASKHPRSIKGDGAGGVYVASTYYDYDSTNLYQLALVHYNAAGDQLWFREIVTTDFGRIDSLRFQIDPSGNLILAVESGQPHIVLFKYSSEGNSLWVKRFQEHDYASLQGFRIDSTGNIYLSSRIYNNQTDGNRLVKFKPDGEVDWIDGPGYGWIAVQSALRDILIDDFGTIYTSGLSNADSPDNILFYKYNQDGVFLGSALSTEITWVDGIQFTLDGNLLIAGRKENDLVFIKYRNAALAYLTISDASVTEGNTGEYWDHKISFKVHLSNPVEMPVRVDYSTADGSAQADSDYEVTSGTLEIPAGGTTGKIDVTVHQDDLSEGLAEKFLLNLTNPCNVELGNNQATGIIWDEDQDLLEWRLTYDNPLSNSDLASHIELDVAGNLVINGKSPGLAYLKVSPAGEILLDRYYLGLDAKDLAVDRAGNVYISGQGVTSLLKYDLDGNLAWAKLSEEIGFIEAITLDHSGNLLGTGRKESSLVTYNYTPQGSLLWSASYKIPSDLEGSGWQFIGLDQYQAVIVASRESNGVVVLKYSSNGNLVWEKHITGQRYISDMDVALDGRTFLAVSAMGGFENPVQYVISSTGELLQIIVPTYEIYSLKTDKAGYCISSGADFEVAHIYTQKGQVLYTLSATGWYGRLSDYYLETQQSMFPLGLDFAPNGDILTTGITFNSDGLYTSRWSHSGALRWIQFSPGAGAVKFDFDILSDEDNNVYAVGQADSKIQIQKYRNLQTPVTLFINEKTGKEPADSDGEFTFSINLSNPITTSMEIAYSTVEGTAKAGKDFSPASGTITIPAGSSSVEFSVKILTDTVAEGDEYFFVNLSGPASALFTHSSARGVIEDVNKAEGFSQYLPGLSR